MSDVIKRGRLEVKKKNLFGSAYKNRCVLLRNSLALNCKTVEILEGEEDAEENRDVIRLNDVWSVQDRPSRSKGRYTFELIKGDEVILTFACSSMMEREEWTESFRILNQLALPCDTAGQQLSKPITDSYFQVTLLKNRSAVEINHSGSYLLSITDTAIVLHWKTGAIAHHWPKRSVVKFLHHPKKEGHLILHAKRTGKEDVVEFEFTATPESSMQILKTWNIRLLESITFNPQQLNEISSVLNTNTVPADNKKVKGRSGMSKSFRANKAATIHADQDLRRADSFSKLQSFRTDIAGSGTPPTPGGPVGGLSQGSTIRVGGLPPLPREANTRSWGGIDDPMGLGGVMGNLSQDSFFAHSTGLLGVAPPPLPPRPRPSVRMGMFSADDDAEDPDYAYIKEDEVEGPNTNTNGSAAKKQRPSISVDDVLNELERDIIRDNRVKKEVEQRRRAQTMVRPPRHHRVAPPPPLSLGPRITFPKRVPQDYTDFVPSKRSQIKSTSSEPEQSNVSISHVRSVSEPDSRPIPSPSRLLPAPVFESNEEMESSSPYPNQQPSDHTPSDYSEFKPTSAPALPPRTWRHASNSSYNSNGSTSNLGSDLIGSVFAGERGVVTGGEGMSPMSEGASGLSDESAGDKPVSPKPVSPVSGENLISSDTNSVMKVSKITPSLTSDKENKAPPTTIPEEMPPQTAEAEGKAPPLGKTTPPPLPPRSPTKDKLSRKSSTSSTSSVSSNGRCPRCRSLRKSKPSVGKTFSLDQRGASSTTKGAPDNCRKSLPDLADANAVPENNLEGKGHRHAHRSREHGHCSKCSPASSTDTLHGSDSGQSLRSTSLQNFDYLQLVGEEQKHSGSASSIDNELRPEMDLLNSCLQTLEYLEHKVNGTSSALGTTTLSNMVSNSSPSSSSSSAITTSSGGSQWTTMGSKVKPSQGDTAKKSVYTQARKEAQQALADLSQPLASTHVSGRTTPYSLDTKKSTSNGHTSPFGKRSSLTSHSPRGNVTKTLPQRSATSMAITAPPLSLAHAPPVPPRSVVSLVANPIPSPNTHSKISHQSRSATQLHPQTTTPTSYNRSISNGNMVHHHHQPVRSASSFGMHPTHATPTRGHPSLTRHQRLNHVEASGQSSTVFIHHIKDSRGGGLTHLV